MHGLQVTAGVKAVPESLNDKRTAALEAALLDYIVRYGATELARVAFRNPESSKADDGASPEPIAQSKIGP